MTTHRAGRRRFLSAALIGLAAKAEHTVAGGFVDSTHAIGHRLRDGGAFPAPKRTERVPVVIAGGGIAGLSAAWRLSKRGFRDFILLEMEREAGGNSRGGKNEVSAYPWAAHYLPLPDRRSTLVRELMTEIGLLRDGEWEERHLCHAPQERLFIHGRWQEGIEPELGAAKKDREQMRLFHERMAAHAASGEFRIPMETGARGRVDLDRISFDDWLRSEGFDSSYVRWLADYSCRDDYGARSGAVSAWAGIHYFASRHGPERDEERGPLTWPEGNGFIVARLLERVGDRVRTDAFVHRVEAAGTKYRVLAGDVEYRADAVIFALPSFLASRLCGPAAPPWKGEYSPWFTANLTLDRPPAGKGFAPAWDNVLFRSSSLGYVDATHQSLQLHRDRRVWTYYYALAEHSPAEARRLLLARTWESTKEAILADLEQAHPDIRQCVSRIDIMRMGHAMIRPSVGFISSPERAAASRAHGGIVYANSDLSGLSLFEEAQYRGVHAADRILRRLGRA
ncbi:MAG: FAD-dependent oxidoreductase [Bryobacteraceae bacterium]